jgi:hypothetical protein
LLLFLIVDSFMLRGADTASSYNRLERIDGETPPAQHGCRARSGAISRSADLPGYSSSYGDAAAVRSLHRLQPLLQQKEHSHGPISRIDRLDGSRDQHRNPSIVTGSRRGNAIAHGASGVSESDSSANSHSARVPGARGITQHRRHRGD